MSVVDDVRDRLDIVEVVGDYVPLKKSGRSYKALCPFHSEKTPSFVVFPETGTWRCFGACATGGDVFSFVMQIEGLDFRGALELLARRAGVELRPPSPEVERKRSERVRLREVVSLAADWFHAQLMRGSLGAAGRGYLHSRGFGSEVAAGFRLGFAPDSWSALTNALKRAGVSEDELLAAGLVRQRESGGVYDAYRGRVVFPINDSRGRTVGFGARTIDPDGEPKYLNSPQTPIFDKSEVLYGLDRAAAKIRETGKAVIVEGYTDVVRAHVAGFSNVVASLGTALTSRQIARLKRYAPTIVLALDADAAGQAATMRGLETAVETADGEVVPVPSAQGWIRYQHKMDVVLKVATLPEGLDPDDVVREDPEQWRELISGAKPVMEHLFQALTSDLDLGDPEEKTRAADRILPLIATIPDPVALRAWLSRLSQEIRIDEKVLAQRLRRPRTGRSAQPPLAASSRAGPQPSVRLPPADRAAWLIGQLLAAPHLLKQLNELLGAAEQPPLCEADLERAADKDLLVAVGYAASGAPPPDAPPEHHLEELPYPLSEYASSLMEQAESAPPQSEALRCLSLREAVYRLRRQRLQRSLEGLRFLNAELEDPEAAADYGDRVEKVRAEIRGLDLLLAPQPGGEQREKNRFLGGSSR